MAKRSAPRLLLGLRPQDHVPDWITHLIIVGNSNEILLQGAKDDVVRELSVSNGLEGDRTTPFPTIEEDTPEGASKGLKLDRELLLNLKILQPTSGHSMIASTPGGEPLIEMDGVRVQYGSKPVLGDWVQGIGKERLKGLYWTVRRGQRWAITGPNGSGKTTLLSLITSDHPQAYAQPMRLFGRTRLPEAGKPGLSLFDLQAHMGQSSPEIHAFFPRQLSIRQAIESAFADTFLSKPRLDFEGGQDINAALAYFRPELDPNAQNKPASFPRDTDGDAGYADSIRFANLTPAQQRVVLFLRAVIHKPDLVILDEPFSGMSPILRNKCIHFLEAGQLPCRHSITAERRVSGDLHTSSSHETDSSSASRQPPSIRHRGLSDDQALIIVGHVKEEIPDSVRNYIRLPGGSGAGDQLRDETLDFRIGALYPPNAISDDRVWEGLWAPASEFARYACQPESTDLSVAVTRHPDDEKFRWDYL
jgi:ABC-type molybdenum transport system ATPase subunit/photorepair protein PhrA